MNSKAVKRRRLRPGTIILIVGLIAAAAYSTWSAPALPRARYFEADSGGVLREVERPAASSASAPKLFKPEPSMILERGNLELSPAQRTAIAKVQAEWHGVKTELEARMRLSVPRLDSAQKSSVAVLHSELSDYSALSRAYQTERSAAWIRALQVLSPKQKQLLEVER